MSSPFSLRGKTVLVTGASSGIGRACAIEISRAGAARCIITGRRGDELARTASMADPACEMTTVVCDLTDQEALEAMVASLPVIDGAVLNAGVNRMKMLQFCTVKDLDNIFGVNCFSPMLLVRQLLKKKRLANPASLVFTGSISGNGNVSPGNCMYGASKAALSAYMKYAALELAPKGVRCNAIHPGRIETPLIHNGITGEEEIRQDMARYPLRRYGRPEEVAYAAIYLLSDATAWMTGSELVIDGGRSLV